MHQAFVGMVRATRIGGEIKVAYMVSLDALSIAWSALPVEDRRLPKSFNWIWSALASTFFFAMLYFFFIERGPTPEQHPLLDAFKGMHVYAFLTTLIAWLWWLYAKDFNLHDWSTRIPRFAGIQTDVGSKVLWFVSVVALVLLPCTCKGVSCWFFTITGRVLPMQSQMR